MNGYLWVWGHNATGALGTGDREPLDSPTRLLLDDVASVSCGGDATLFLLKNNDIHFAGKKFFNALPSTDCLTPELFVSADKLATN